VKRLAILAVLSAALMSVSSGAARAQTQPEITDDPTAARCAQAAAEGGSTSWVCIGSIFLDNSPGSDAEPVDLNPGGGRQSLQPTEVQPLGIGDEDDTICENVEFCDIRVSDFISRTKANAAYGDASGFTGTFDILLTTNLNGRSPRYTYKFIHDTGPALVFDSTTIECIDENGASPINSDCGPTPGPDSPTVSAASPNYTSPLLNKAPLEDEGPYLSQLYSRFMPEGGVSLTITPLNSELFFCPIGQNCTFNF